MDLHILSRSVCLSPDRASPVTEFVFQVRMFFEHHQRTLPLQVSHETRYADLRWDAQHQMYVIRHQMSFQNLYSFVFTQCPYYFLQALSILIVNYFSSILWCEYDMVFAHPFRMRQTICFICHKVTFLSLQCSLNNHIITMEVIFW